MEVKQIRDVYNPVCMCGEEEKNTLAIMLNFLYFVEHCKLFVPTKPILHTTISILTFFRHKSIKIH
jgi:hypothetical protein